MGESGNSELFKRVIAKTKQYRRLMQQLGYGQTHILLSLAKVLDLDVQHHPSAQEFKQEMLLKSLSRLFSTASTSSRPSQPLTHILVSLEIAISHLTDEESDPEDQPSITAPKQHERKEKPRKKNNDKKKAKKGKQSALQEIQSKANVQNMCERIQLVENLKKIELLKQFLQRKMLLDLCQQSMLQLTSAQVYA